MTRVKTPIGSIDAATKVLGEKWTPQLLRYFVNEDKVRFCQLQDLTEGINPRTLSARLDGLVRSGIIVKETTGTSSRCEYSLTAKGRDLLPVLQCMESWSDKYSSR